LVAVILVDNASDGCGNDGLVAAIRAGNDESIGAMGAVVDCLL
jgi:hypothetical protein